MFSSLGVDTTALPGYLRDLRTGTFSSRPTGHSQCPLYCVVRSCQRGYDVYFDFYSNFLGMRGEPTGEGKAKAEFGRAPFPIRPLANPIVSSSSISRTLLVHCSGILR